MKNHLQDVFISDFNYITKTIHDFVKLKLPQFIKYENPYIFNVLEKKILDISTDAITSNAKRLRPLICTWVLRNYYLSGDFSTNLSDLSSEKTKIVRKILNIAIIIEILHSASLVIDDIEDGSLERRGKKSIHVQYGMPHALNCANWMYFLVFKMLPKNLVELCHSTLFDCHIGQALDLNSNNFGDNAESFLNNSENRWTYYNKCAELKTSRLIIFSFDCLKEILNLNDDLLIKLKKIFMEYGVIYQIFDDIKNLIPDISFGKIYEDLNYGIRSAVVLTFLDILSEQKSQEALKVLFSKRFKKYFLEHEKRNMAIISCYNNAKNMLSLNSNSLYSLCLSDKSKDYLSKIIDIPFNNININSAINPCNHTHNLQEEIIYE
jgi:geranylgeranyl pyrophosphate synthase